MNGRGREVIMAWQVFLLVVMERARIRMERSVLVV
jgi:hypothetical protein